MSSRWVYYWLPTNLVSCSNEQGHCQNYGDCEMIVMIIRWWLSVHEGDSYLVASKWKPTNELLHHPYLQIEDHHKNVGIRWQRPSAGVPDIADLKVFVEKKGKSQNNPTFAKSLTMYPSVRTRGSRSETKNIKFSDCFRLAVFNHPHIDVKSITCIKGK